MSQRSTLSTNSDGMRSGPSSRRGSAVTGDSENTTIPAVTINGNDSGQTVKDSGSGGSLGTEFKIFSFLNYTITYHIQITKNG